MLGANPARGETDEPTAPAKPGGTPAGPGLAKVGPGRRRFRNARLNPLSDVGLLGGFPHGGLFALVAFSVFLPMLV